MLIERDNQIRTAVLQCVVVTRSLPRVIRAVNMLVLQCMLDMQTSE